MKRFLALLLASVAIVAATHAQTVVDSELPSNKQFRKAVKTLMYKTNGHDITPKRMKAMELTQSVINRFTPAEWRAYRSENDEAMVAELESKGVPYFLRQATDKVCREVRTTDVKEGTVAVWLLYNMSYVIKTPTLVFGIDICTKYADELAEILDFAMITHNHRDHYDIAFLRAMNAKGKPVYAAFDIQGVVITKVVHEGEFTVGDVTIRTTIGDHNKNLRNFVTSYEIDCGAKTANTVIYHTGDSKYYKQLNPQRKVDLFIPHMSVGLNIQKALDKIQPQHLLLSHHQELGHGIYKWRWTFHDALKLKNKLTHDHIWIPCWGERVIYNRKDWKR